MKKKKTNGALDTSDLEKANATYERAVEKARKSALADFNVRYEESVGIDPVNDLVTRSEQLAKDLEKQARRIQRMNVAMELTFSPDRLIDALCVPHAITFQVKTDEMEKDPISGHLRPRYATLRQRVDCADTLNTVFDRFADYVCSLTALAKNVDSPAYMRLREIYIGMRAMAERYERTLTRQAADDLVHEIIRLHAELKADVAVENVRKEVGRELH